MSDDPLVRVFKIPSNKVYFKKHPRYGTWSVNFDKGGMAKNLQGQFTSFQQLYDNTNHYLQNREKWKCEIGEELTGLDAE